MSNWIEQLERARSHVRPSLEPQRMHAIRSGVDREIVQRPRRRAAIAAAVVGVLLVIGVVTAPRWQLGGTSAPVAGAPLKAPQNALMVLDDGSTVQPLSEAARVEPVEDGATKQAVRLAAGKARFEVTPRQKRSFEVRALDVTVSVLGTAFVVAIEGSAVHVQVEHGRVRVSWPGGTRELRGGEHAAFDAPKTAVPSNVEPAAAPAAEPSAQRAPPLSWRALEGKVDYKEAYARMVAEGPAAVRNDPEDLLLAADVARLGGQPARAVPFLERVVKNHAGDSRAPLAAFTLGRVLLDQLGRPREAAAAFAQSRRMGGAMAQDALAREVESWSRAGESSLARERATEYVERFPKGRRLKAVQRFGGLD